MKLFDKTRSYTIITDKENGNGVNTFAVIHRVMSTKIDAMTADGLFTVTFTTRLDRAELVKKLRIMFGNTHNVRIRNNMVLLTRMEDAQ